MADWKKKLDEALNQEEKRKASKKEKEQIERDAYERNREEVYNEFFIKVVEPAFDLVKEKFGEKKIVEIFLPKEDKKYNFTGYTSLTVYHKPEKYENGTARTLLKSLDEQFLYSIKADIETTDIKITSKYHYQIKDNRVAPWGRFRDKEGYEDIAMEDIVDDIVDGYTRMINDTAVD
jgi:hypothetical protein